ncbi:MAG: hypothetical protein A3G33_04655 [Omnitrophica bacterium RIFCSPLOWO2_12_FULL_44_17]|uniref:Glycosyltransferase 2-like domain-containing protein n=1 Tax=Candidatus Danuiimicrobium aquiferis TaxID=1801832 RepID=A0A1G1KQJ7_9BACT|nr:MAG: hypothetical protein A3B72_10865 [Omnitrophica bacterium RIFCSPHIGHO2_02_FULL_45_28]OGW88090.1 MAG: hypothetical protein A3E74_04385 [Omnitrophica bacterium RIFCSPHIGHO2_12_FULL_44_12]OGW95224.1 MAG: hypothetical protein A3G33_04655 [Omnitrophica bacterium RIFCSPLOWO2_12_FULL_44_17]
MPDLSVIVITYNEEKNIEACLKSVQGLASEIYIVDSFSSDGTLSIAERYKAKVCRHEFKTHACQWQWALQHLPLQTEWVLALDADQRLSNELRDEICLFFNQNISDYDGIYINRRNYFFGKWIRYGGYYPKYMLKLFRRSKVFMDPSEYVDAHFYLNSGKVLCLKNDLIEENLKDDRLAVWIDKHKKYAKLQAREEYEVTCSGGRKWPVEPRMAGNPNERTLWLKKGWYASPRYLRAFIYFFYRFFIRLGFLDGFAGVIFHVLQGLWYRLLIDYYIGQIKRTS